MYVGILVVVVGGKVGRTKGAPLSPISVWYVRIQTFSFLNLKLQLELSMYMYMVKVEK